MEAEKSNEGSFARFLVITRLLESSCIKSLLITTDYKTYTTSHKIRTAAVIG